MQQSFGEGNSVHPRECCQCEIDRHKCFYVSLCNKPKIRNNYSLERLHTIHTTDNFVRYQALHLIFYALFVHLQRTKTRLETG